MSNPHHLFLKSLAGILLVSVTPVLKAADTASSGWQQCGWGGGGFYYSEAFHPTKDGVIYLGGDVNGVYRSDDHGLHFKMISHGIADYGVFTLAVDPSSPDTVYAATEGGLCKSTDEGEHWQVLPQTGKKDLHITGEKGQSIRSVAVDPKNSNIVFAGSPEGTVFKSTDGGQTWKAAYSCATEPPVAGMARVQYGGPGGAIFGGIWFPITPPQGVDSKNCTGIAFDFQGGKEQPDKSFFQVHVDGGAVYMSKNIADIFANDQKQTVVLTPADFTIDGDYAGKHPDQAKLLPATPDLSKVNRIDIACVGGLDSKAFVGWFGKFYFQTSGTPPGKSAPETSLAEAKDLSADKQVPNYGNVHLGDAKAGTIYSVSISPTNSSLVLASTKDAGVVMSEDGGATWHPLDTPKRASSAVFAPTDPNIIYATFFTDGMRKSTDKGKTWTDISTGFPKDFAVREVAVSPVNPQDIYAIGAVNTWAGSFFTSHDGGTTWVKAADMTTSPEDPTMAQGTGKADFSGPTNISINPKNPQEIFVSANWRSALSADGGVSWNERDSGADMSCVYDIRFSGPRTYVTAMDEGSFTSPDDGNTWKQLWPLKFSYDLAGHNWRMGVTPGKQGDHLVATVSPWDGKYPNRVVVSDDSGATFKVITAGLPDYIPHANTMWGQGYARALSVDPNNPNTVYLGIDGDPENGKNGGGIFKSVDGGNTWAQLEHQPASRRMFFGLQVDPTDSKRIFWGACGSEPGLYRTEDGGETWSKNLLPTPQWIFNLLVTKDGTIYCPAQNLWRSTDHGNTWKMITDFKDNRTILGLEVDPRDSKTIWISQTTWDGSSNGAVYKTTDGGTSWQDITDNIPNVKPMLLRFNPATEELWAGGVGLYKIKQPAAVSTATNK
jgi:photosystem II stability/assembly factor-like uncharacterized protein